jgi:hypothetical protein
MSTSTFYGGVTYSYFSVGYFASDNGCPKGAVSWSLIVTDQSTGAVVVRDGGTTTSGFNRTVTYGNSEWGVTFRAVLTVVDALGNVQVSQTALVTMPVPPPLVL